MKNVMKIVMGAIAFVCACGANGMEGTRSDDVEKYRWDGFEDALGYDLVEDFDEMVVGKKRYKEFLFRVKERNGKFLKVLASDYRTSLELLQFVEDERGVLSKVQEEASSEDRASGAAESLEERIATANQLHERARTLSSHLFPASYEDQYPLIESMVDHIRVLNKKIEKIESLERCVTQKLEEMEAMLQSTQKIVGQMHQE